MCPAEQSFFQVLCLCAGLLMICHRVSAAEPAKISWQSWKPAFWHRAAVGSTRVRISDQPGCHGFEKSWEAFIETYRVEKSLPDPQISATFFPRPIETRLGPQDWNLTLSQAIPFPGTLTQKARVLESDAAMARIRVDKTVKAVVAEVSSSFYELGYIQTAVAVAQANLALVRQMLQISENAYSDDKALFYDVSKARAQTAQLQYDLLLFNELEKLKKSPSTPC